MTPHEELSKLRKEEICPQLGKTHCQKYVEWHRQAKKDAFNWQKLEELALLEGVPSPKKEGIAFKKGTKLLGEYQGKTHQVLTKSEGFLYEDTPYKSLTAITNKITGKKWNGNLFFKCRRHG